VKFGGLLTWAPGTVTTTTVDDLRHASPRILSTVALTAHRDSQSAVAASQVRTRSCLSGIKHGARLSLPHSSHLISDPGGDFLAPG